MKIFEQDSNNESLLSVKGLKKYFPVKKGTVLQKTDGLVKAVDGVTFSIRRGETFALIGESGCGKTTTAKVILLLEKATDGQVTFGDIDVLSAKAADIRSYRRSLQAVFQDPYSSLEARMRIGSIVSEPLRATSTLSKQQMDERVREVMAWVGLRPDSLSLYPHEFSGGQRQRIAVARALASQPDLIILDEPVSALDVSIRAQIMNLLKDIQDKLGVAYLLVAHDLATVRHMCHRIGIMYLGKLAEISDGEDFFSHPLHPYAKALLSAALPSHPRSGRQEIELPGEVPSPLNPPSGCRFHPRCSGRILSVCSEVEPSLLKVSPGHYVACHLVQR